MANRLKMALAQSIHTLHQQGWSQRRIARVLGINRETVARHLRGVSSASKPVNAPLGSDDVSDSSKPANAPLGSPAPENGPEPANAPLGGVPDPAAAGPSIGEPGRSSECEPWRGSILERIGIAPSGRGWN